MRRSILHSFPEILWFCILSGTLDRGCRVGTGAWSCETGVQPLRRRLTPPTPGLQHDSRGSHRRARIAGSDRRDDGVVGVRVVRCCSGMGISAASEG
jgi:hypothetical protein